MTDLNHLSSDDLLKLYEERRRQEEAARLESVKHEIQAAKDSLKELEVRYRKERAALEAKLTELLGKPRRKRGERGPRNEGISNRVLEIIRSHGQISTKEINKILEGEGKKPKNLSQSMTYLKKRNQVASAGRGFYKAI